MNTAKRIIAGAALFAVVFILRPDMASAQLAGVPSYKTSWQATNFMTVTFTGLGNEWTRKILALGPATWNVTYRQKTPSCTDEGALNCYVQKSHEEWSIPDPIDRCYAALTTCTPSDDNDTAKAKWLWATGGCVFVENGNILKPCNNSGINAYAPSFAIHAIDEPTLYQNNAYRGDGPGMLWEPNPDGDLAFWTQGAYGYAQGGINYPPGDNRAGINVVGAMIPLRWSVEGFYD